MKTYAIECELDNGDETIVNITHQEFIDSVRCFFDEEIFKDTKFTKLVVESNNELYIENRHTGKKFYFDFGMSFGNQFVFEPQHGEWV